MTPKVHFGKKSTTELKILLCVLLMVKAKEQLKIHSADQTNLILKSGLNW